MSSTNIILKKSSVPDRTPTIVDLEYGELALNYADGKLYYKTSNNTIGSFGGSVGDGTTTGTGSVVLSSSPTLTGTPIAPTAANNTNTTQIATTEFANTAAMNKALVMTIALG